MGKVKYKTVSPEVKKNMSLAAPLDSARPSIGLTSVKGEIYHLPVEILISFHNQARSHFEEESLRSLADSIKQYGVIQPLQVTASKFKEGFFEVVSGERRLKAALSLNLDTVPCMILSDAEKADEVAFVENIQRENLHPIELGEAFKRFLSERPHINHEAVAQLFGMARSTVSQYIRYTQFPDDIKRHLIDNKIAGTHTLRALLRIENPDVLREKVIGGKASAISNTIIKIISKDGKVSTDVCRPRLLSGLQKNDLRVILQELLEQI